MDWTLVILMVGLHALMFLTPGPDSIVVVSRAASQGFRHALAATFGIVSAGLLFVPAIAFGLDIVNDLSPAIWMAIRAAGAGYLMFVGYVMLKAAFERRAVQNASPEAPRLPANEPLWGAYLQGLLTNLGNPKMLVLLTSFLPQFVAEELGHISTQILVLGAIMYLNGLICFTILSLTTIMVRRRVVDRFGSGSLSFWGGMAGGGSMIAVGAWMMLPPIRFLLGGRHA